MVPGLNTELEDVPGLMLHRAENLQDVADDLTPEAGDVSVIAWLDYDAPEGYTDDANLSVVGHSYGSTTTGWAAAHGDGLAVDDLVVAGSPGTTVDHAADLHIDRRRVWAGAAPDDDVANYFPGTVHGDDPTALRFEANQFHVDTSGHGNYWEKDPSGLPSQSLANQAAIITGDYDYFDANPGALDHTSDQAAAGPPRPAPPREPAPYGPPPQR